MVQAGCLDQTRSVESLLNEVIGEVWEENEESTRQKSAETSPIPRDPPAENSRLQHRPVVYWRSTRFKIYTEVYFDGIELGTIGLKT